jgi:hypothetical protein
MPTDLKSNLIPAKGVEHAAQLQLKIIHEKSASLEEEEEQEVIDCPRCGFKMKHLQPCHMMCPNCGAHMDCSEKGLTW